MTMVIVTLHLKVAPEKRFSIIKTIRSTLGITEAHPDCFYCELFGSTQDDDTLVLLEKWKSQESLEKHIQTEEFRKILTVMDETCEPPEITFNKIDSIKGMELVENVLGD